MSESFRAWCELTAEDGYTPLTEERLSEMFEATCKFGSGNLWTGTTGPLAGYVRELLRERVHLASLFERATRIPE